MNKVTSIDREAKTVQSDGISVSYDKLVLATGSYAWVPPIPGGDKKQVLVYRTIDDMVDIVNCAKASVNKSCVVIGGGLLGLEAANAVMEMGCSAAVVDLAPLLMTKQLDEVGGKILQTEIDRKGVKCYLGVKPNKITSDGGLVTGMELSTGETVQCDFVIVCAGVKPRDELMKASGLEMHPRGGVLINNHLQTNDPNVYAIGECCVHKNMVYGLVGPGYSMAAILADVFTGEAAEFYKGDVSTSLKLLGVNVSSFGDYTATGCEEYVMNKKSSDGSQIYKKLLFSKDLTQLVGGILVGDTTDYGVLNAMSRMDAIDLEPEKLLMGGAALQGEGGFELPDDATVCSCHNLSRGAIDKAIVEQKLDSFDAIKAATKAGSSCGGCVPLVTQLFKKKKAAMGEVVTNHLCEHFKYSRQELFHLIVSKGVKSFDALIAEYGTGLGCENCKPHVANIMASHFNDYVLEQPTILDTNDRYLANIQRDGTYSIIPRIPGGEILPKQLIAIGTIAEKYGLYLKISGSQRVVLFGAQKSQLPAIWGEVIACGLESGHGYAKALRMVKSCVGSTWCRYGLLDSVSMAILLENRYRGVRAPHKLKSGVSGCVRECAEAQGKDFGLVATNNGWNLFVGGNGGAKPRHAELLVKNVSTELCIKYIDRFLAFYIKTADKLQRTARWIENMQGGLKYLYEVIVDDSLGICADLEKHMLSLIDTYQDEWATTLKDPERLKDFQEHVNVGDMAALGSLAGTEMMDVRGQKRPVDWPQEVIAYEVEETEALKHNRKWIDVCGASTVPRNGGASVLYGDVQIAIFRLGPNENEKWYATQNMCPHKRFFGLAGGMVGDTKGEPKVACPMHKKTFSLKTGKNTGGESYKLMTFEVRMGAGNVIQLLLPPIEELDPVLSTKKLMLKAGDVEKMDGGVGKAVGRVGALVGTLLKSMTYPAPSVLAKPTAAEVDQSLVQEAQSGMHTCGDHDMLAKASAAGGCGDSKLDW
jgi:NAD(P)H-dependent nitrite reductase large subunit/NAD(P)H-dependent nitrite reductase small subunit